MRGIAVLATAMVLATAAAGAETTTAPAAPRGEKIALKAKFTPGKYLLKQDAKVTQQMTPEGGEPMKLEIAQTMVISQDIGAPDAQGRQTIALGFRQISYRIASAAGAMEYDSAGPVERQHPALAEAFGALMGARAKVVLGPDGRVESVSGMDQLWDTLAKQSPALAPLLEKLKQPFGDKMMRDMIDKSGKMLPKQPVAVGESWPSAAGVEMPFVGSMEMRQESTLREVEKTPAGPVALIDVSGKVESSQPTTTEVGGAAITVQKFEFTQAGQARFNVDTGMQVWAHIQQTGKMDETVPGASGEPILLHVEQDANITQSLTPDTAAPQTQPTTSQRPSDTL